MKKENNNSKLVHDEAREADLQKICDQIVHTSVRDTGDYGMGAECPFCYRQCFWSDKMEEVSHESDCIYLIAKDLLTE